MIIFIMKKSKKLREIILKKSIFIIFLQPYKYCIKNLPDIIID
jgi:hypothetical protein